MNQLMRRGEEDDLTAARHPPFNFTPIKQEAFMLETVDELKIQKQNSCISFAVASVPLT